MRAVFITLMLLIAARCAVADRGGVLFYAGFDGTANAIAAGDGTAQGEQGGPHFAAGKRGEALLSGENAGYVSYAVDGNVVPERGTIELWACPQDWAGTDSFFHVFFEAENPGWLLVYKYYAPGSGLFLISRDHETWTTASRDFGGFKPGEWHHLVATWSPREICFYLDGKPSPRVPRPQIPRGLSGRFLVGDRPWHFKRDARSLVDELYIYDRALGEREVQWAFEHAADRPAAEDVPEALRPPMEIMVRPVASKHEIRVDVEVNLPPGAKSFSGVASLEPAAGTAPAPLRVTGTRSAEAAIPFTELPAGDYEVRVRVQDDRGREIGAASQKLASPGPPVWRGNTIGISDTPPPPWTPLRVIAGGRGQVGPSVQCWGRTYVLGELGLPRQVTSAGRELMGGPAKLRAVTGGRTVDWKPAGQPKIEHNAVKARLTGSAQSELGTLRWTCTAEFDGMLRYDLALEPAPGAVADSMELRVPLDATHATLDHLIVTATNTVRGSVPQGDGAVFSASWAMYWWLGDEARGLAGFCESDEAWDRVDRPDGFRIERSPGCVEAVWSFNATPRALDKAWTCTFGLQATPVKDITGWRKWRLVPGIHPNVYILWPTPDVIRYFGYPEATDPAKYRALVKENQAKGIGVVPYSLLNAISSQSAEWSFYGEEWANGAADTGSSDVVAYKGSIYGCSPTQDWLDFVVWANDRYVSEYDLDGLYHDWTMVFPSSNQVAGFGYLRDGKVRPTYPIFGTRELYKRIYTMLKAYGQSRGKEMFMMGHMSSQMLIPVLSFCDSYLDAEHFRALVKDNYLDVVPLDQIRAEFMGHNWGVMPFFLPEFTGEYAEKPEPTQHLVGLSLLHDFALWPIWCKTDEVNRAYAVLDDVGIVDAELVPYWSNGEIIRGQTDQVKCTAYRKSSGGALLCVVNLTRQRREHTVTINWKRLGFDAPPALMDALTKKPVTTRGRAATVTIEPLSHRLLRAR